MTTRALRAWPLFVVALCVTLAACGGGDSTSGTTGGTGGASTTTTIGGKGGTGGTGGAPSGSLEADYCAPLAAFVCKRLATCGCGFVLPSGTLDEAACGASYTARCLQAYAPIESAVASGTARILSDAAHACVALLEASTPGCERPRGSVAQALCPSWFTSDSPLGAACDFPICAAGQGLCVNAVCQPRPPAGDTCAQGGVCAEGLVCVSGACAPPAKQGESCDSNDACEPPLHCVDSVCASLNQAGADCTDASACALGLVCDSPLCAPRPEGPCLDGAPCGNLTTCAAPRTCKPQGTTGAPCAQDEACSPGFYCDQATSLCAEGPGVGLPCVNTVLCGPGLACDTDNGNCIPVPGDGAPCAFGPMGPFVCQDGLGCNNGVCGPLPGDGQPCTVDSRCAAGLGCDFTADGSFCVPLKDEGGSCQTDRTCKPGLFCDYSKNQCALVRPTGAPCKDGNECGEAGSCMPDDGGSFRCAPLPSAGDRCLFDCEASSYCGPDAAASACLPDVCKEL